MKTSSVASLFAIAMLILAGFFVWFDLRGPAAQESNAEDTRPAASVSEELSDGLIEVEVRVFGNLIYQIDVQFSPEPNSAITVGMPPEINISMEKMHMDGFEPPLELVGAGAWRARGKMPMAGRWILSVGFGEEFAELIFDVE